MQLLLKILFLTTVLTSVQAHGAPASASLDQQILQAEALDSVVSVVSSDQPIPAEGSTSVQVLQSYLGQPFLNLDEAINKLGLGGKIMEEARDRRTIFAMIYVNVLKQAQILLKENFFRHPEWIAPLMLNYVNLYRSALWADLEGHFDQVPDTWLLAFAHSQDESISAPLLLMLSINAHISRDLPHALLTIDTDFSDPTYKADFENINLAFAVAATASWPVIEEFGYSASPIAKRLSGAFVKLWIKSKRAAAWKNGSKIVSCGVNQAARAYEALEKKYVVIGKRYLLLRELLR